MKRDLSRLTGRRFDVAVIGGGIQGAFIAWEAALRGLDVALIEKGDFGGATSHNSLKILHGGLRYLQHADFKRIQESVREANFWVASAPRYTRKVKFTIPTFGHGLKGPEAMRAAFSAYRFFSGQKGKVFRKANAEELIPSLSGKRLSGAAEWEEAQIVESDRALLAVLQAAENEGAVVLNYAEAAELSKEKNVVSSLIVKDRITEGQFSLEADLVINAAGPWIENILNSSGLFPGRLRGLAKGMNLVTRQLFSDRAFGIPSARKSDSLVDRGSRLFFITPWKNFSLIGTSHLPFNGNPDSFDWTEEDLSDFLSEVNQACPSFSLKREDVYYCYAGLTPSPGGQTRGEVSRARQAEIIDHAKTDEVDNLMSVRAVKYTTARDVAEKALNLAEGKIKKPLGKSVSLNRVLPDLEGAAPLSLEDRIHLAAEKEMALSLPDAVFRRTGFDYWLTGTEQKFERAADIMAEKLKWPLDEKAAQIALTKKVWNRHTRQKELINS